MARRKKLSIGPSSARRGTRSSSRIKNSQDVLEEPSAVSREAAVSHASSSATCLPLLEFDDDRATRNEEPLVTSAALEVGTSGEQRPRTESDVSTSPAGAGKNLKPSFPFPSDHPISSPIQGIGLSCSSLPRNLTRSPTHAALSTPSPAHTQIPAHTEIPVSVFSTGNPKECLTFSNNVVVSTVDTPISTSSAISGNNDSGVFFFKNEISALPYISDSIPISAPMDANISQQPVDDSSAPFLSRVEMLWSPQGVNKAGELRHGLQFPLSPLVMSSVSTASPRRSDSSTSLFASPDVRMLSAIGVNVWIPSPNGSEISVSSPINSHVSTPLVASPYISMPSPISGDISNPTGVGTDMCTSSQVNTGIPEMSPVNDINGTSYTENPLKFPDDDNSAAFSTNTDISTHLFTCGELSARAISTNTPFPIDDDVSGISPKGNIDDAIFDRSCRDNFIHVPSSVDAVTYNLSSDTTVAISTKFEVTGADDHAATSTQLLTPAPNAILNPIPPHSISARDSSFPLSSTNVITAPSLQRDTAPQVAVSTGLHSSSSSQQPNSCYLFQQNPAPHFTFAKKEDIPVTTSRSNTISDQPFVSQCGIVHPSNGSSLSVVSLAEETFSNSRVHDSSKISSVYVSGPSPYVTIGGSAQTSQSSFHTARSSQNPKRANSLESLDNPASSLWSSCNVVQSSFSSAVLKQQLADTVVPESCTYSVGCKSSSPLCDVLTSTVKGVVNKGSSNCICVGQKQFKRTDREPVSVESATAVSSASLTIVTKSVYVVPDLQPNIPVLLCIQLWLDSNSNDDDHPDPYHGGQISISLPQLFDTDDSVPNLIEITLFEPTLVSHSTPETSPISAIPCIGLKSSPSLHLNDQDLLPSINNILGSSSNISNSILTLSPNKKLIASENNRDIFSQKYVAPELSFTGNERSDLTPSGVPVEEVSVSCDFATENLLTSTAVCDSSVKTNVSTAHNVAFTDTTTLSQDPSVTESTSTDTNVSMSLSLGGNLSQPFPIDTDPMFCSNEKNDHVLSVTNSNVSKLPPYENNVCKLFPLETDIPMPFAYEDVGFLSPCVTDSSLPSALTVAVSTSSSIPSLFNIPHPATSSSGNDIQELLLSNPETTPPPVHDIPMHCSTETFIEHSYAFPLPASSTKEDETIELFSSHLTVPHINLDNEPSSQLHIPESHGICSSSVDISLSDPSRQDSLKETLATHSATRVATPYPLRTPRAISDPYTSLKPMTDLRPRSFCHATDTPSQNVDPACLSSGSWIADTSFLQGSSIAFPSNETSKAFISHNSPPKPSFDEILDGLSFLFTTECPSEPTDFLHNELARTNNSETAVLSETVKFGAQTEDSIKESCDTSNPVVQSNNTKHLSPTSKSTKAKIAVLNFPIVSKLATNNSMPRHSTDESFLVAKPCDDSTPENSPLKRRSEIFEALRKGEPLESTTILNEQTKSQGKSQQKPSKKDKTPKSAPRNKTLLASFSLSAQLKSNSHTTQSWLESCTASSEFESEFNLTEFDVMKPSDTQASGTATKRDNNKKDKVLSPLPDHSSKFCTKHTMPSSPQSTKPVSPKQDVKTRSLTMKTPLIQLLSETSDKSISQAPKSSDKNISQDPKSSGKTPKCEVKDEESSLVPSDGPSDLKYMEKEQVQSKPVLVVSDMSSNANLDTDSNCDARNPSGSSVAPPSKLRRKKSLSDVYNDIRLRMKRPKSKTSKSKSSHLRSLHAKSLLPPKYSKFKISTQIFKSKLHRQQSLSTSTPVDSAFQSQTVLSVANENAVPKCDALELSSSQTSPKVPANDINMADTLFSKRETCDTSSNIRLESTTLSPDTSATSMLPPENSVSSTPCKQISVEIKSPESRPSSSSHLHSGLPSTLHICKSHTQEHSPSQSSKRWTCNQKSFSFSSQTSRPHIQNYSLSSEDKTQTKVCSPHMLTMSQRLTTGASDSGLQMANEAEMLHTEAKRKPSRRSQCYFMNTKERDRCRPRCKRQNRRHGGPNYRTTRPNTDNSRKTNKYRFRQRAHFHKHGIQPYDRNRTKRPYRRYTNLNENVMPQLDNHYQNEPLFDHGNHLFQVYEGEDWSLDMHRGTVNRICTICSSYYRTFDNDLVLYCYVCREMVIKIASRLRACMCISCLEPFVRVVEEEEEEDVCAVCLQKGVVPV
ncbi:uncharacterized protein LOC143027110 [Oratosquilla oratoria]|uniref:uncharacterized protein LOC143027110 n=1 Tax=Oratosquilla oratoria TaxID=337810 RepID=UPI003F773BF0